MAKRTGRHGAFNLSQYADSRLTFTDGVLSALQVLYDFDGGVSVAYETVVSCHGPLGDLVAAAKRAGNYESSGMAEYVTSREGQ